MTPRTTKVFQVFGSTASMAELEGEEFGPIREIIGATRGDYKRLAACIDIVRQQYPTAIVRVQGDEQPGKEWRGLSPSKTPTNRDTVFTFYNGRMNVEWRDGTGTKIKRDNKFGIVYQPIMATENKEIPLSEMTVKFEELLRQLIQASEYVGFGETRGPKYNGGKLVMKYAGNEVVWIPVGPGRMKWYGQTRDWEKCTCFGFCTIRQAIFDIKWRLRPKSLIDKFYTGGKPPKIVEVDGEYCDGDPEKAVGMIRGAFEDPSVRCIIFRHKGVSVKVDKRGHTGLTVARKIEQVKALLTGRQYQPDSVEEIREMKENDACKSA